MRGSERAPAERTDLGCDNNIIGDASENVQRAFERVIGRYDAWGTKDEVARYRAIS